MKGADVETPLTDDLLTVAWYSEFNQLMVTKLEVLEEVPRWQIQGKYW
jgi:hypothetical protein